ncbi:MAG: TIM44-like domain-containing protein [Clostridia bacterium]|nr:TIM44-like domain-containing protein [Clostridia bacterium]
MKRKLAKKILKNIIIIAFISIFVWGILILSEKPTYADSGFDASYDSGSGSSGSSHKSDRTHKSRSNHDSHKSSSSTSSRSSSGTTKLSRSTEVIIIVIGLAFPVAIIVLVNVLTSTKAREKRKIKKTKKLTIENGKKIRLLVPSFDEEEFLNEGFEIYKNIQEAWMNFNLESVRDVITDEMFNMYQSQLETLKTKNEQNIMKDMICKNRYISKIYDQNGIVTIETHYTIEQYDYIIEKNNGKVLRGTDSMKMRVEYELKFRLSSDENKILKSCPNCGASWENHNGSGICEYCGAKIVSDSQKWVLTDKKAIDQHIVL